MSSLRSKLIRLAHSKPELRSDLLPLLKQAAGTKEEQIAIQLRNAKSREDALIQRVGLEDFQKRYRRPGVLLVFKRKSKTIYIGDNYRTLINKPDFLGFGYEWKTGSWSAMYWPHGSHSGVSVLNSGWTPGDVENAIRSKYDELKGLAQTAESLLENALKKHDWYGAMSDDSRYWAASEASMQRIKELLLMVDQDTGRRLWNRYAPANMGRDPYAY